MTDIFLSVFVVAAFGMVTIGMSSRVPREARGLLGLAFAEYVMAAVAQLVYSRVIVEGGDAVLYARSGEVLRKLLDDSFSWAAGEITAMLLQQPSVFDHLVEVPQSNTGSMFAATAWVLYLLRGSAYAANFFVGGLAFVGSLGIYFAFQDAAPHVSSKRLFVATALFPSVAFWTSTLHKESFCIVGIGALLTAWRGLYNGKWGRVAVFGPLGLGAILLFRAPAFPPLLLGLLLFFVVERLRKMRGADALIIGPAYLALVVGLMAVGMILLTRLSPALSLERIGETVSSKQAGWALSRGGSSFDAEGAGDLSVAQQLARVPLALVNALFRPQLFDVHNFGALISAIEMTLITWLVVRSVLHHGPRGIVVQVQRSPFLAMCAVVTLVGCAFVGLVTLNFGSLARYRVPFLPFYGALVAVLSHRESKVLVPPRVAAEQRRLAALARRRPPRPAHSLRP